MKKSTIIDAICGLLILLFTYTAASKLMDYEKFVEVLSKSPMIEEKAGTIGWLLPLLELAVSALLFFPTTKKAGLIASFALMSLFTIYIAYMIMYTPRLPCSCGGVIKWMSWKQHLVFNAAFVLIASIGIVLIQQEKLARQERTRQTFV